MKAVRLLNRLIQSFCQLPGRARWTVGVLVMIAYCWVFYAAFVAPTGFRWRAIYGDPDYPKGYSIHGIDISHHQGHINWHRLRNALVAHDPLRFVFVKATEGDSHIDTRFRENFDNAKEAGFIRGAYHFWSNQSSPRRQAYYFTAMVRLEPGDLPPVLDVETKPADLSTEEFQRNILTWLHIVEDYYQVKPIIYTYYNFKQKYLNDSRFDGYPYWIAHYYVSKMGYRGPWKFWQHTDAGRMPGIGTYVDLNIYNGSYYDLKQLTIPERKVVVIRDSASRREQTPDSLPSLDE